MRLAAGVASGGQWPQGLPRLPRTPRNGSQSETEYGRRSDLNLNLDDTPPPASPSFAMRHSPSPEPEPKRRELSMLKERPRSQIYAASVEMGQGQGAQKRTRPQSQIYKPTTAKQQHGGPRAPSQMQHHHQRQLQRDERDEHEDEYRGTEGSGLPERRQPRRRVLLRYEYVDEDEDEPLRERQAQQEQQEPQLQHEHERQHQPRREHQPQQQAQHEHQPQPRPQPQPRRQHRDSQMQPQIKIESPAPMGGRDRLADIPRIELEGATANVPTINVNDEDYSSDSGVPTITVQGDDVDNGGGPIPNINVYEVPGISISVVGPEESELPSTSVSGSEAEKKPLPRSRTQMDPQQRRGGLICGGCDGPIVGRIVNAMGARWHPGCFRCTVCDELLEHVSSYEHEGRAYCHLDYHEVSVVVVTNLS